MSRQGLDISVSEEDGVTTIALSGAVDAVAAEQLKAQVLPLCDRPRPRLLLDCSGLTYVSSLCMGQFTLYHRRCQANGGGFALYGVDGRIYQIMKLIHLDDLISICASREDALAAMG